MANKLKVNYVNHLHSIVIPIEFNLEKRWLAADKYPCL